MGQDRAAIYCRISDDREGAGLGVARQERECRALAEQRGLQVVGVYTDNDISAYSGRKREHYERLLGDIEGGRVDVVLAWHTDRLHRRLRDLLDYTDLVYRHGVPTHCVKAGHLDLSTASGRMQAKLGAVIAEHEVERMIERARSKRAEMAQAGEYRGGMRPFGYESDGVTVREGEADELRAAARRVVAGESVAAVAADWNERKVTTARGTSWTGPKVRRVLLRLRNAGRIEHHGEDVGAAQWPAVLDEDAMRGLRSVLGDGAPTYRQAPKAQRLLSGVARCGVDGCDGYLIGSGSSAAGTHRYRCSARRHLKRQADALDDYIAMTVVDLLSRPDAVELVTPRGDDATELHAQASAIRSRLDGLSDAFMDGEIDRRQLNRGTDRGRAQLAAVDARLAELSAGTVLDGIAGHADAATIWETLPIERQRAIVDATVTVTVLPGRRGGTGAFDPAYVRVERKHAQR